MTERPETRETDSDWDAYWRNARSAAAHLDGGPQDVVLERFWSELFAEALSALPGAGAMLDVGCGNGAVTGIALSVQERAQRTLNIVGIDESPAAVSGVRSRQPGVACIAADAARMPFRDGAFNLVTSQFGLEYAGSAAVNEALRVLGTGGVLAAVLHLRDGGLFRECATNLEAITGYRASALLVRFRELFNLAWAVQRGEQDKDAFHDADRAFARSVKAVEEVFRNKGKEVGAGTLFRIYTDIGHMYPRLLAYEPAEMNHWIDVMTRELDSYAGRMSAMLEVALGPHEEQDLVTLLESAGLGIRRRDRLHMEHRAVPFAWVLIADRK